VFLHDMYLHDLETEAFYVGYNNYEDSNAHELKNVKIYNNVIRRTGWDAIQVRIIIYYRSL